MQQQLIQLEIYKLRKLKILTISMFKNQRFTKEQWE